MESKKVSVIIPTYSRTKYIERAINSVLNQTYKNIEIIVVDDNNEDSIYRKKMEQIMKSYEKNKNIIYIKHKKNKNGATARNTGIKASKGEYIAFLDDDDYYLENRIAESVKKLENNPQYKGVYAGVIITKNKKIVKILNTQGSGNFLDKILAQKGILGTGSNVFLKKEVVKEIGLFDENFFRHQDLEYMARFFEKFQIIECSKLLVVKCQDDRSNELNIEKSIKARIQFLEKFKTEIEKSNNKKNIYFSNYFSLAIMSLYKRDYVNFKKMLKEAKKYKKISFKEFLKIIYGYINGYIRIISIIDFIQNFLKIKKINIAQKEQIRYYEDLYE